ncbi:MAG: S8 family peptidase [Ignavibacteria bacterium]|nr:S8 family peptidase [Ignavibacteria bacterium]
MNKYNFYKFNFILIVLVAFSMSFFSFRDTGNYTMVNDIVIKNGDGVLYQKGQLNLKFKSQIFSFTSKQFGVQKIDNILHQYDVTDVIHLFPFKQDFNKWTFGDDNLVKIFRVKYESSIDPFELSEIIMNENSDILDWVEPNIVYESDFIPNDPSVSAQYHISRINAYQGWDINKGDTNIVIGIVDSGSDLDHPDLQANIKRNWLENPTNGIDDDNNGYIDDWIGWDFIGGGSGMDNDPQIYGNNCDHGSHVSGDASQVTDNNVHGAGVGFKVKLLISKHGNDNDYSGPGGTSYIYNSDMGIVYCYQNGADVINCSFGSGYYSSYTQSLVSNAWAAGCMVVASAGNDGMNIPRYPASYDNVVSAAATTSTDAKAFFSNYHSTVDVCAPGQGILSTLWNNTYASFDGTSMSAPITAGNIGLIRSKYPSWTPSQVLDRLLLGVDSIYNIPQNSSYVGLLGTGRINTFKALSDLPIVYLNSFEHNDSIYGNNDKVYDVGEVIPVAITYKNTWLAGTNVSLRLTTTDPDVEIVKDSVFVGNLSAFAIHSTTFANTFEVKAKSTCPMDKNVTFKIGYSNTAYSDNNSNTFTIRFRQGFATHNINNLKMSLTNDGAVGKKTQPYGNGLLIGNGTVNMLYEGGLMIGINNTQVSDICRRGSVPANVSDTDFVGLSTYVINTPGVISDQDGSGLFNDEGAGANKIGVQITAESFAWNNANDEDYILLKYHIKNTNSTAINGLYAGIFIYFSPNGSISGNVTSIDTANKVGYTYNAANPDPYLGAAVMTSHNLNFHVINAPDLFNGFTTQEKWNSLYGLSDTTIGPGGNAMTIAVGPLDIDAGETEKIGFAIVTGTNLSELITNTVTAKAKYAATISVKQISELIPTKYELYQNYPNPFNPTTIIKFAVPKNDFVSLKVYDILGKEVAVLLNGELEAGVYDLTFDASRLSSGMYFYKVETNNFADTKKMLLLK